MVLLKEAEADDYRLVDLEREVVEPRRAVAHVDVGEEAREDVVEQQQRVRFISAPMVAVRALQLNVELSGPVAGRAGLADVGNVGVVAGVGEERCRGRDGAAAGRAGIPCKILRPSERATDEADTYLDLKK